ncbi:methyltransferase RsmF C-terminal domain-like protein [Thermococcus sp.]
MLEEQFGYAPELIYEIRGSRKIYAYRACGFDPKVRADRGIYFGRIEADGIRLSIEGSFLVGPGAVRNILEIDDERALRYLSGEDIEIETELEGWIILKWGKYYLGTARLKNGRARNYIPKERRMKI